ncbi:MAG: ABC transporter permease [Mesorhizobium amorphae]|nr:MAG: ABC transporter permease [Mesorhizobium amorphae]
MGASWPIPQPALPARRSCRAGQGEIGVQCFLTAAAFLETDSSQSWPRRLSKGLGDIRAGLAKRELWSFLGWREVRKQYQRSVLGPFWLTLNMGILVGALGFFYSQIFQQDITTFLPYLAVGFIVWGLLSGLIVEACTIYTSAAASVRQSRLPLSVYAYQLLWRQFVIFLHNFVIYVIVALVFGIWPGVTGLLVIPAAALTLISGFFLALILGPLSARFRDVPPIMTSIMQIFFFLTPIFWTPENLPERALFLLLNPFYHFVEIMREPLFGRTPELGHWLGCIGITAALAVLGTLFFSRVRARIPYWA